MADPISKSYVLEAKKQKLIIHDPDSTGDNYKEFYFSRDGQSFIVAVGNRDQDRSEMEFADLDEAIEYYNSL
jgi:hypothetical protein